MTKKETVLPEQPESPAETDATSMPETLEATEQAKPAEKVVISEILLKIYTEAPQGKTWTLPELVQLTGADEHSVCIAWHRLFDQKLIANTSFVKL